MFVALNTNLLRSKNHPGYVAELHSVFTSAINMKDVTIVKNNPRVQMLGRIESTGVDFFFFFFFAYSADIFSFAYIQVLWDLKFIFMTYLLHIYGKVMCKPSRLSPRHILLPGILQFLLHNPKTLLSCF